MFRRLVLWPVTSSGRCGRAQTLLVTALTLAAGLVLAVATPATAHVTVNPREATQGGFAKLAFRAPNERPDAGTVKIEVEFPSEHPIAHVSVRPKVGWSATISTAKLDTPIKGEGEDAEEITEAVSTITWEGGPINPGEFEEFEVSAGPLPKDADELVFKALQTYDSGEVVRWIEETGANGEEPEHPAPVLELVEPVEEDEAAAKDDTSDKEEKATAAKEQAAELALAEAKDDTDSAKMIAVIALLASVLSLGLGALGLSQRRRPSAPAA